MMVKLRWQLYWIGSATVLPLGEAPVL